MKNETTMREMKLIKDIKQGKLKRDKKKSYLLKNNREKLLNDFDKKNNCKKGGKSRHTF